MIKFIIVLLFLPACMSAVQEPEEKKSFYCSDEKITCIHTKEVCVILNKERKCTTSVDVTCNSRGDEKGKLEWQTKVSEVGNNKTIVSCQVQLNN